MNDLLPVFILTLFALALGGGIVFVTTLLGPQLKNSKIKKQPYECGIEGDEASKTNVSVRFYLTAILFILFDIEIIFMYPWAISFMDSLKNGYGLQSLLAMSFFCFHFHFWFVLGSSLESIRLGLKIKWVWIHLNFL